MYHLEEGMEGGDRSAVDPDPKGDRPAGSQRKYKTACAARKSGVKNLFWREKRWPKGLYLKVDNGRYFYRAKVGKSRPFLELGTDDREIAKRRLHDKLTEIRDLRASGATSETADFRTLGALADEFIRIVARSNRKPRTVAAYKAHIQRLRENWVWGDFDTYLAVSVDKHFLFAVRTHLQKHAEFVMGYRWNSQERKTNAPKLKKRKGFSNNIVNQTMWTLSAMMDIAVEKRVRVENPFRTRATLEERMNLPKGIRSPELPSHETMMKVFAEMRRVPDAERLARRDSEHGRAFLARKQFYANRAADLAEFLAYSGCRHEEAMDVRVGFDGKNHPGFLYVDGTKSKQAKRDVPIIGALRPLLDRLKEGKNPADLLFLPSPDAKRHWDCLAYLKRACTRLGIRPLVQHELRHYFATQMLEEGVSFALLATWLGHADGGLLAAKTYGHLRKDHARSEAERITASLARKYGWS